MKSLKTLFILSTAFLIYACGSGEQKAESNEEATTEASDVVEVEDVDEADFEAIASLTSASGSSVTGEAEFKQYGDGTVGLKVTLKNASPGLHAVHLHQNGDCSAADATSAGGHWNPMGVDHGQRGESDIFHQGDIANLEVGPDSVGVLEMSINGWTIGGADSTNILNKAVIVHAGADDFTSQPSGAAGARVACGVVQLKE